ncbi:roles in filamentous growth, cell polarity, and cellular elongation [Scheffersomyces amazonensis]|uniref:roles in filamentous growth, cell polarity, and cellular elongation n=1 Tax=Scheffersomyces amazonensis TaxID=1078765 RepID=UPI00315D925D
MVTCSINNVLLSVMAAYTFMILNILLVKFYRPLNNLLLHGKTISNKTINDGAKSSNSLLRQLVDFIVTLTVPKSWFTHYYIVFTVSCCLIQLFPWYGTYQPEVDTVDTVTYKNYKFIHVMMSIQAIRRTIESFTITKFSSNSRMNFTHYIVGLAHYILISINCYGSLVPFSQSSITPKTGINGITVIDIILFTVFLLASIDQFLNHYHLSTLKKYTIPSKFKYVSSPHYLDEIIIYVLFFISSIKNITRFSSISIIHLNYLLSTVFVVVNLSISSIDNYKWYKLKFKDEFRLKWSIIPGLI